MSVFREASVTAVIPTRNRPEMVLNAVRSALAQTTGLVEVIVVVDGPDAATIEALASFDARERDARLRVLALPASVGGAEARNLGVRRARAGWVAFLDDDDCWLPHKLAEQLREAEASGAEEPVIASAVLARGPRRQSVWPRRLYRTGTSMAEYLFCRDGWSFGAALLQTSTLMAPRELLLRIPFEAGLRKHQDWDWLLRVSADAAVEVRQVAEPLAVFHVEGRRASVGRSADWRFSQEWACSRREWFTPRAYSAFLATECAPQAARAGASLGDRTRLLAAMAREGSPTLKLWCLCLTFLVVPQIVRRAMRDVFSTSPAYTAVAESSAGSHG